MARILFDLRIDWIDSHSFIKIFVCPENGYYNQIRSLAQYFINDLSLDENYRHSRTSCESGQVGKGFTRRNPVTHSWAGSFDAIFRSGSAKRIVYKYNDAALIKEMLKDRVGYLVCPNRYLDILMNNGGIDLIKQLGIKLWLHNADHHDPEIVKSLKEIDVPSLSNYSAGEIGPIAYECQEHAGFFHVAHTNVVVEGDNQVTVSYNGASLQQLLITHLHSYATPIIRYNIGDFGQLENKCRCGHDGPTISNIFGRGKHFVRLRWQTSAVLSFNANPAGGGCFQRMSRQTSRD